MNNEELKEIGRETGMKNIEIINKNDGVFNFSCSVCDECCRNRDDIMLSPYDVF